MDCSPQRIFSVSDLTLHIRNHLERGFTDIWVEGEISNLRVPASGHLYFTLKDQSSQIRAVLYRTEAKLLRFSLREGMLVIVRGRLTVYAPRGEYQAILDYLEPKGVGALHVALEQLKEKLTREGLFDRSRKRPLPLLPRRVGLVTSLSGAAIRDMLTILQRRCPLLGIVVVPVLVQGAGAAQQIAGAVRELSGLGNVDVIIVGRGGGSLEDLWAFNEEIVVRAIAESACPVVSAVGHEIDYTLSDFAADHRAPTPSAAAEIVAPILENLVQTLRHLWVRQERGLRLHLSTVQQRVAEHCGALSLSLQIQRRVKILDTARERLGVSIKDSLGQRRQQAITNVHILDLYSSLVHLRSHWVLVPQLVKRLEQRMLALLALRRHVHQSLKDAMDNLSPLAILARGYSIVRTIPGRKVIKKSNNAALGDHVEVILAEGHLLCRVQDIHSDPNA